MKVFQATNDLILLKFNTDDQLEEFYEIVVSF